MLRSSSAVSADWVSIREAVLRRDNYKCRECGKWCRSGEADVHHLLPRSAGGPDEPSNLVTLCDGCHAAHHPKLAGRLARRVMEKIRVPIPLCNSHVLVITKNTNLMPPSSSQPILTCI